MEGYLGTTEVDVSKHPEFSQYTQADWAMFFIGRYGQFDGGHHKAWVLDQVARILKGTKVLVTLARWENGHEEFRYQLDEPSQDYKDWVKDMLGDDNEYDYDEGCAP